MRGKCAVGPQGLDDFGEEPVVMKCTGCCGEDLTGTRLMSGTNDREETVTHLSVYFYHT